MNDFEKNQKLISIEKKILELKNEKKRLQDPSFSSFKTIEENQIMKNYLNKDKQEILSISNKMQLGLCIEDKKSDMIDSILKMKSDVEIENKLKKKKKKYTFKIYKIDEIKSLNEERLQKILLNNINTSYILEKYNGRFFKSIDSVYGIQNFYTTINRYLCIWYNNNGWNQEKFLDLFLKHDKAKVNILKEYLPHVSNEFENKFLKLFGNEDIYIENEVLIFSKWTRKGFCLNIGCKQDYSNCTFIWMYKVYFIPKHKSFRYEILIKGSHDNFLIGEGSKYAKSIYSKSLMNDLINENKSINEIRKEITSYVEPFTNDFNKNLNQITRRTITLKKYSESKKKFGIYENCYNKAFEFFKDHSFKNIHLISYDMKNLNLIFININDEVYKNLILNQIYIDGTFKTKFWRNSHYSMLVIAINMKGSLVTMPVAFSIGFKGRSIEYLALWNALKVVLKKFGVNFSNLRGISDLGKSELCAFKEMDLLNSFYCWWHTLEKCFIPKINELLNEKYLKDTLIQHIRFIYCSKSIEDRKEKVLQFKKLLLSESKLSEYFEYYLNDEILDKWSSLYKISQYAEHTSNYLESLFSGITNKNIARQTKLLKFIKSLNEKIDEQLTLHHENSRSKLEKAKIEFQKGYKLYLALESIDLNNNIFKVPSLIKGNYYIVDFNKWHCTCLQFNSNCYTCKHMFYLLIEKGIQKGMDYKKLQNVDVYTFLKNSRKLFLNDEKLIKLIDLEEFPVTIGIEAFHFKYKNYKFE